MGEGSESKDARGEFLVIMDTDEHLRQAEQVFQSMGLRLKPNGYNRGFSVVPGDESEALQETG